MSSGKNNTFYVIVTFVINITPKNSLGTKLKLMYIYIYVCIHTIYMYIFLNIDVLIYNIVCMFAFNFRLYFRVFFFFNLI